MIAHYLAAFGHTTRPKWISIVETNKHKTPVRTGVSYLVREENGTTNIKNELCYTTQNTACTTAAAVLLTGRYSWYYLNTRKNDRQSKMKHTKSVETIKPKEKKATSYRREKNKLQNTSPMDRFAGCWYQQ